MELKSTEKQNVTVVRLAKHVIATVANGSNIVFSPTSINALLSLIAVGSSHVSKENILSFLMLPSTDHLNAVWPRWQIAARLVMCAAYSVWIDKMTNLSPSNLLLKSFLENFYSCIYSQVDFNAKLEKVVTEPCFLDIHIPLDRLTSLSSLKSQML
ncbi:unnamed protein product [Microthlaspi erraticum]|uniref:Serpin domain-containing protein n=1 Tax=Microthlaspi erraticum TaxID=1685480 RepID=A0A6D2IRT6_9BRAS|nr:unnamed protein product [Microthlaspi erraticum]